MIGKIDEMLDRLREETLPDVRVPRPMLATALEDKDLDGLHFPLLGSPKIDGYRGLFWKGRFYARSGKPHPCPAIQALAKRMSEAGLPDLDGELIVPGESFNTGGGKLRRLDYTGPVGFLVYDLLNDGLPFLNRWELYSHLEKVPGLEYVTQAWLENKSQLLDFENACLAGGFEGVVVRKPSALYKHGRGTLRDQIMLKLKRFHTAEARVLELLPRMHNENPQETSPLGYAERSSAKEGLLETNILGRIKVQGLNGPFQGQVFHIGTFDGLTEDDKIQELRSQTLLGKVITYKYFPTGAKDRPRHPVYLCERPDWDREEEQDDREN